LRALTISRIGGLENLELRDDLPVPEPGPGQVRVKVKAAALNHLDLFVLRGLPGTKVQAPWTLGADATGTLDKLGPAVKPEWLHARVGDTLIVNPGISDGVCEYCLAGEQSSCVNFGLLAEHHPGTLAEYVIVPARNVHAIPKTVSTESAAAFTLATLTAWRMVHTRAKVKAGENVLIQGIGGGVAIAALQISKQIGATVWVTSGSEAKLEAARQLGADHLLNYRKVEVGKEIRDRTRKRGVDVVIDDVGEATWQQSFIALGKRGRFVTCGATTGPNVQSDVRRLFWNQWDILGSTMGNNAEFAAIAKELSAGRLLPPVDSVYPLEQGREAFARLEAPGRFGKIVVRIAE
jgi:NADPH:quinone reductase-like Zn-dependent oxidoreductase